MQIVQRAPTFRPAVAFRRDGTISPTPGLEPSARFLVTRSRRLPQPTKPRLVRRPGGLMLGHELAEAALDLDVAGFGGVAVVDDRVGDVGGGDAGSGAMGERVVATREAGREVGIGVGGLAVECIGGGAIAGFARAARRARRWLRGRSVGEETARQRDAGEDGIGFGRGCRLARLCGFRLVLLGGRSVRVGSTSWATSGAEAASRRTNRATRRRRRRRPRAGRRRVRTRASVRRGAGLVGDPHDPRGRARSRRRRNQTRFAWTRPRVCGR
jgi:hypothetical protein